MTSKAKRIIETAQAPGSLYSVRVETSEDGQGVLFTVNAGPNWHCARVPVKDAKRLFEAMLRAMKDVG